MQKPNYYYYFYDNDGEKKPHFWALRHLLIWERIDYGSVIPSISDVSITFNYAVGMS